MDSTKLSIPQAKKFFPKRMLYGHALSNRELVDVVPCNWTT
ncbi:hypothetical protein [Nitrosomonas sp. PLL12-2]|nr:hypothetical protein [Nitrosomonas sp. PLL12-2]